MKINKRLLTLSQMVKNPYQVVWDCCCDHGLLGIKILADGLIKQVNFVDIVPELIDKLEHKLIKYGHHLPSECQWQTICQNVAELRLIESSPNNTNQLVIISGVGGELMVNMLTELMERYAGKDIDFLLCPVHHTYKLRKALIELNFGLKQEQYLSENKRDYELMLVNQVSDQSISSTGDLLWKQNNGSKQYLLKLISHYQRIANTKSESNLLYDDALRDYKSLYKALYKEY